MKKKIYLTIIFLLSHFYILRAQWVTIPDPVFVTYLQTNYPACMSGNQMDTTCSAIVNEDTISMFNLGISNIDAIQYFDNLQTLWVPVNSISNLPPLPAGLLSLDCTNNNLDSLPPLPSTLELLGVGTNHISQLVLPTGLLYLDCSSNPIHVLPSLPPNLVALYCGNDTLSYLPELPTSLQELYCSANPNLTCLPLIDWNIQALHTWATGIQCIPSNGYYAAFDYDINPYFYDDCSVFNPNGCPIYKDITGYIYMDINLNCVHDSTESNIAGIPIQLFESSVLQSQTYSSIYGYGLESGQGNFEVVIDTSGTPFTPSCLDPGLDSSFTLLDPDTTIQNVDFGLICKPGYDLGAFAVTNTSGIYFPGLLSNINIRAGDAAMHMLGGPCNTFGISGNVQVTVNGPVTYIGPAMGSLTPSVAGNVYTYTVADFSTLNMLSAFNLLFTTDTTANDSDLVCFDVQVTSSGIETSLLNNSLYYCGIVTTSFDPNIKEVYPSGNVLYPYNDWLTYTIHFQNTGSAPAININIKDTLDADLDPSTFKILNYSHPVNINIAGNIARFSFYNIYLMDSTTNEPLSHGYIQYKIKPNGTLPIGTIIANTAHIYFDYNSPITTNTVQTTISMIGIENENLVDFSIYPNPANDHIIFSMGEYVSGSSIIIRDMLGNMVKTVPVVSNQTIVEITNFPIGLYIASIYNENNMISKKIVVSR